MPNSNHQPAPPDWEREKEQWSIYYSDHLKHRLEWMVQFIHQQKGNLASLEPRMGSLLTLLQEAHLQASAHPQAIELISSLHPWPLKWEYWEAWEYQIQFAIQYFQNFNFPDLQTKFQIYLSDLLEKSGRLEDALEAGQKAFELAQDQKHFLNMAIAGASVVSTLISLGKIQEAESLLLTLSEKIRGASPEPDTRDKIVAEAHLVLQEMKIFHRQGKAADAIYIANRTMEQLDGVKNFDQNLVVNIYKERGNIRLLFGDYPGAAKDLEQTILLLSREGDKRAETFTRSELGNVYLNMSNFDLAEIAFRDSIATCERINARWQLISEIGNLTVVYLSRGLLQQALTYVNRQIELAQHANHQDEYHRALSNRAFIYIYLKRYSLAIKDINTSLDWFRAQKIHSAVIVSNFKLGMSYDGLGDRNKAQSLIEDSYEQALSFNIPSLQIFGRRCLAAYHSPEKAKILLYQALLLAQKFSRRLDEAGCLLALAEYSESQLQQLQFVKDGKAILQEIGATAWLDIREQEIPPLIILPI